MPQPQPGPAEILVRVRACGLNRADLQMVAGVIHGQRGGAGTLAGIECAGEVAAVGPEVVGLKTGDRVMCGAKGAFAEDARHRLWPRDLNSRRHDIRDRPPACRSA